MAKKIWTRTDAEQFCREAGLPIAPRRALDCNFPNTMPKCWVVYEKEDCAIVFYDDDPVTQVSTGNSPNRFIPEERVA